MSPRISKQNKNETKAEKFVRLANNRINATLKMFKRIGQLGNAAYESTPQQRQRIKDVLTLSLNEAIDGLNAVKVASKEFKL